MSDKTAELLPCPFCGKLPEIFPSGSGEGTMIECQNDACVQPHTSWIGDGVALRYWNTRNWSRENEGLAAIDEAIGHYQKMRKDLQQNGICGQKPNATGDYFGSEIRTLQSIRAKYATEGKCEKSPSEKPKPETPPSTDQCGPSSD